MSTPHAYDDHQDPYAAENAVDLRAQRLRRQDEQLPESPQPAEEPAADEYDDPYLVGQDALAAVEDPQPGIAAYTGAARFDRDPNAVDTTSARWGWRGRVNAATGMNLAPKPESAELRYRKSVARIQQPLPGCNVVTVISLKGGSGKTPTTLTLSNTFGEHRRGVVAWDANESAGTLGVRAARTTTPELGPWDVLEHASELASASAVSGALGHYLRPQPTHDEILAADPSTIRDRGIGWNECAALMAVLRRHRDLIFIDTGNNPLAENWRWAVRHANLLVVPLPLRRDMAIQALQMLEGIAARGFEHLVQSAIVLTVATPESDPTIEADIVDEFGKLGVQSIFQVPYEPRFGGGERLIASQLSHATTEAYTNIAAEIADALAYSSFGQVQELSDPYAPERMSRPPDAAPRPPRQPVQPFPGAPAPDQDTGTYLRSLPPPARPDVHPTPETRSRLR